MALFGLVAVLFDLADPRILLRISAVLRMFWGDRLQSVDWESPSTADQPYLVTALPRATDTCFYILSLFTILAYRVELAMDQEKDAVVPGLLALIRDLDQRSTELKRAVNAINRERGEALTFQNGELAGSDAIGSLSMKTDQFYGQKIHTAMRQYLVMRKSANLGPATLPEIYKALCDGGLKFETENEDNRKANLRFLLRKNTSIFHRLPDKIHFGLAEWYPSVAKDNDAESDTKKRKRRGARSKPRSAKNKSKRGPADAPVATASKKGKDKQDVPETEGVTQEQAVREAVAATVGEFKRQDIVDWIEAKYPAVQAQEKRTSIFAMLGKLGNEIELVTKGKGAEPSIYRKATAKGK